MWKDYDFISIWSQPLEGSTCGRCFVGIYPAVTREGGRGLAICVSDEGSTDIVATNWGDGWWNTNDDYLEEAEREIRECIEGLMSIYKEEVTPRR